MAHIDKSDRGESAFRVRVNANGRIVIPASVRRELGVEAGDEILLEKRDDVFWITTQQQRIARAQERARRLIGSGPSMSAELIAERREAARRE
jgi:AbrB family looped-hinge helix DNA binding protein